MKEFSDRTIIVSLALLALVLRAWGANSDLWLDEITAVVGDMRGPLVDVIGRYRSANQHVLNSMLGNVSIRLLGESPWTVRLPAILFGVAAVPAFFLLARRVTTRKEAILASLFLAISYHHIWFSQNARGYSAMIFCTVVSTIFLHQCVRKPDVSSVRNWGLFAVVSTLGMLSLLNYAFVVIGQFLALTLVFSKNRQWRAVYGLLFPAAMVAALTLLGYSMMLSEMADYFTRGGEEMGWNNPSEFAVTTARGLIGSLPVMVALPALLIGVLVAITGGLVYLKTQPLIPLVPGLAVVLNLAALAVLDFGAYPRSFLYILPFALLILMRGAFILSALPRRYLPNRYYPAGLDNVLPVLALVAALAMLPQLYRYPKQDYSGALAYAQLQAGPGDTIAAVGYLASGYKAYAVPGLVFPATAEELDALRTTDNQVWVLYSFSRDMARHFSDINRYLDEEFRVQRVFPGTLGDGDIYLVTAGGEKKPAR